MKACFFAINFSFGLLSLVLGIATLMKATDSFSISAGAVGVVVIALAGVCLGFCKDCLLSRFKGTAN